MKAFSPLVGMVPLLRKHESDPKVDSDPLQK